MTAAATPDRVFAYGTLRIAGGHPMARLLAARGRRLGTATVCGILLDVGPYPAAVRWGQCIPALVDHENPVSGAVHFQVVNFHS